MPCQKKQKQACACGKLVKERLCGAYSSSQRANLSELKCAASCEVTELQKRHKASVIAATTGAGRSVPLSQEDAVYAADLHRLASINRLYLIMVEDAFLTMMTGGTAQHVELEPCDSTRRLLVTEYARRNWRLRTVSRPDSGEGWWSVRVELSSSSRAPRPLLSELATSSNPGACLAPALVSQPCLHFLGLRGSGDELYDILGLEGVLGLRPGPESGEVLAFLDRSSTAAAAFKRLTGQVPGSECLPVRVPGGTPVPLQGVRVSLQQSIRRGPGPPASSSQAPGPAPAPAKAVKASKPSEADAAAAAEPAPAAPVPDNWEDAL